MSIKPKFAGGGRDYGRASAVRDFNLDVEEGEFASLLGPSGYGKTTMLRSLAGRPAETAWIAIDPARWRWSLATNPLIRETRT